MAESSTPNQKTLFVVGAGASAEVNLPVGAKLTESIASALNFKHQDNSGMSDLVSGDNFIYQVIFNKAICVIHWIIR